MLSSILNACFRISTVLALFGHLPLVPRMLQSLSSRLLLFLKHSLVKPERFSLASCMLEPLSRSLSCSSITETTGLPLLLKISNPSRAVVPVSRLPETCFELFAQSLFRAACSRFTNPFERVAPLSAPDLTVIPSERCSTFVECFNLPGALALFLLAFYVSVERLAHVSDWFRKYPFRLLLTFRAVCSCFSNASISIVRACRGLACSNFSTAPGCYDAFRAASSACSLIMHQALGTFERFAPVSEVLQRCSRVSAAVQLL